MRIAHLFVLHLLMALLLACQAPCVNQMSIFDEATFDDPEYQKALQEVLLHADEHQLRFYVRDYLFQEDKEFLVVKVHGPKICAEAHFLVTNPSGIKGIRNHLAKGYRGAELRGLAYSVSSDVENRMLYRGVERIVD